MSRRQSDILWSGFAPCFHRRNVLFQGQQFLPHDRLMKKITTYFLLMLATFLGDLHAKEEILTDLEGKNCYVYLPETIDPALTYQLIVGVHGAGGQGNGAAGLKPWAQRGDVIVIGPCFDSKGERPYQNGDGIHAKKLIALFEALKKSYKLKDKMFLHGFSGGCQFTHRFTMLHPKLVCGVSAHSGGSWATDGYGTFDKQAKDIPFAISCGEKDTAKSFPEAPYNRLDWHGRFQKELEKNHFCYRSATWPNVGHSMSAGATEMLKECFQIATGLPGESATQPVTIRPEWKNLSTKLPPSAPKPAATATTSNQREIDGIIEIASKRAAKETIPVAGLIAFMKKYPIATWQNKPGCEALLQQCTDAMKSLEKSAHPQP